MARYEYLWRNKWITSKATSIDDFIRTYGDLTEMFKEWKSKGVKLDPESDVGGDYASFYVEDKTVADELEFDEMEEFDEDCDCGCCDGCCCVEDGEEDLVEEDIKKEE
jgi:hypothetical protein